VSNWDVLVMCLRNMFKRKLRTFLTILGVMVGTAAIVLMISLGLATEAQHRAQMEEAEDDMTMINVWMPWELGEWCNIEQRMVFPEGVPVLNDDMVDSFAHIPGVQLASPIIRGSLFFRADPYYMEAWDITGIRPEVMQYMGLPVAEGRVLQGGDDFAVVFGASAERAFELLGSTWPDRGDRMWQWGVPDDQIPTWVDVMRAPMRVSFDRRFIQAGTDEPQPLTGGIRPIRSFNVDVVGLLQSTGDTWGVDRQIFMDIETLLYLQNERSIAENAIQDEWQFWFSAIRQRPPENFENVMVRVTDMRYTASVAETIEELGFRASYPGMHLNMLVAGQRQQQQLLAAIGAISLIIAAIGIANTMIMAVYERTREIGIMKVIGAAISDIRRMFLLESAMIGFFGGLFGVLLSLIGSYVLNNFDVPFMRPDPMLAMMGIEVGDPSLVTAWLCGAALVFAGIIGLVSGYFPARRATKLSALAAIRSE